MTSAATNALARIAVGAGTAVRDGRRRRRWTLDELAGRAGLSRAHLQSLEAGEAASLATYARVATALELRADLVFEDPRGRATPARAAGDFVHAAMGEFEAVRLRRNGYRVAIDEPYQHYQFAGRADVVAWDIDRRVLLHIENRTQFPNVQEALGSYAAKRAYLPDVLADRLGLGARGWATVDHAIVALWSAEVLHVLRLRRETFLAACPDPADDLVSWLTDGRGAEATARAADPRVPGALGRRITSALVILDPDPAARDRYRLGTIDDASRARPRYRDYADAAARLREPGSGRPAPARVRSGA